MTGDHESQLILHSNCFQFLFSNRFCLTVYAPDLNDGLLQMSLSSFISRSVACTDPDTVPFKQSRLWFALSRSKTCKIQTKDLRFIVQSEYFEIKLVNTQQLLNQKPKIFFTLCLTTVLYLINHSQIKYHKIKTIM